MFQNVVMGGLMVAFVVWCVGSILFGLLVWPKIARHMKDVNGLDKDSE